MKTLKSIMGRIAFGLVLTASVFLQGCLNDDDEPQIIPTAYVSLFHASPDAPEVDIVVDSRKINAFPFKYSDFTGYQNFYTGERNIKFTPVNASNALIDTTVTLVENKIYSLFVANTLNSIEAVFVGDSLQQPAENKARVRFVHLSPDAAAVDAAISSETAPLFTNLVFKQASEFKEVPSGKHTFVLKQAGGTTNLLTLPDVTFNAGRNYTIVIRGFQTPPTGNTNALSGQVLLNY
jgi:hypothetical protein